MHVLVVDDDDAARAGAKRILELGGHRVTTAATGSDALRAMFTDTTIEVVLLDIELTPEMSGWDVQRVKFADPHLRAIPTIVLTGRLPDEGSRNRLSGVSLILTKPYTVEEILGALAHLERSQRDTDPPPPPREN